MKKILVPVFLLFTGLYSKAQTDTLTKQDCGLRISLLTCTPGSELYATFGHSALRVIDSSTNEDIVFNYGTFDFDDPQFYQKFIRGKLLYLLSVTSFSEFMLSYQYEGRGVAEQVLDLSCKEKRSLFSALIENAKEENKYYKYDFVYDNCTTRLRDIVFRNIRESVITKDVRPEKNTTFRNLIHDYLDNGKEYWSKLGIDILLGMPLDKKISNNEAMFLPDYLMKAFDSTDVASRKLVSNKSVLLNQTVQTESSTILTPMTVFILLLLIIASVSFLKPSSQFLKYFDIILFFLTGALGLLLLFMWFGTDHGSCKNNLNLIWAFPPNIIMAFYLNRKKDWVRNYLLIYSILLIALLIFGWFFQQLNYALIPIMLILLLRCWMHFKLKSK